MSFVVSPYRFALSGPTTNVTIAVQDFSTGTTTGVQTFTSTAMTGVTPQAALVFGGWHQAALDPGPSNHALFTIGSIANGQNCIMAALFDASTIGSGNTIDRKGNWNTHAVKVYTNATILNSASGSLASGGISLNFDTNTTSTRKAFVAFAGSDVTAANGSIALGTGTSAIGVNVGFQPDVVILFGDLRAVNNNTVTDVGYTFGIATGDGTQRCVVGSEASAITTATPYQAILTNRAAASMTTGGAFSYGLTVGGFSSTGFTVTPSASAGSQAVFYLALKFTGRSVKIKDINTPTSTGAQAITGVGFTPQFALAVLTNLEATDPTFPLATDDLMGGLSFCAIGDEQWSVTGRTDSGNPTPDTQGNMQANALYGSSATAIGTIVASLTSFDADGMTLNYSAAAATAKKGFALFVQ